jgi:hypothetical protein
VRLRSTDRERKELGHVLPKGGSGWTCPGKPPNEPLTHICIREIEMHFISPRIMVLTLDYTGYLFFLKEGNPPTVNTKAQTDSYAYC